MAVCGTVSSLFKSEYPPYKNNIHTQNRLPLYFPFINLFININILYDVI